MQRLYEQSLWTNPLLCPACDSTLDRELPAQLAEKLQQYKDADEGLKTVHAQWRASNWPRRLKSLEDAEAMGIPSSERHHAAFAAIFGGPHPSLDDFDAATAHLDTLEAARKDKILGLRSEKNQLEQELPPSLVDLTERVEHASNLQHTIRELMASNQTITEMGTSLTLRSAWAAFIEAASAEFAGAEVRLSTNKTTALAGC